MIILHIGLFENSFSNIMKSVIFQETAKLKKPVPAEKVIELSDKLLEPSNHSKRYPPRLHKTWGTIFFMIAIHLLSLVALQPQFWSMPAVTALFFFYWLTACLGVTLGCLLYTSPSPRDS